MKKIKPETIYLIVVFSLIISKIVMGNFYPVDQFIIYNFFSLLMMASLAKLIFVRGSLFFNLFPLVILTYLFLNLDQLKLAFMLSHHLIIIEVIWLLVKQTLKSESNLRIGLALIPIEMLILISFR